MKLQPALEVPAELDSSNLRKHLRGGRLQRWLIQRFQGRLADLAAIALSKGGVASPAVLEVGCGEGFVLSALAKRLPGCRFVGLDASLPALRAARLLGVRAPLVHGDALRLPFGIASFDLVVAAEVLEHLEEPWLALEEMARVGRGPLLLSVPHQPYFSLANLLRGKNLRTLGDDPDHRSHWPAGRFLEELGRRAEVRRVARSFPWLVVLAEATDYCPKQQDYLEC